MTPSLCYQTKHGIINAKMGPSLAKRLNSKCSTSDVCACVCGSNSILISHYAPGKFELPRFSFLCNRDKPNDSKPHTAGSDDTLELMRVKFWARLKVKRTSLYAVTLSTYK